MEKVKKVDKKIESILADKRVVEQVKEKIKRVENKALRI